MLANIFGLDGGIVLLIALVVLVGGSQLPKLARNVGLAGKEFRKAHDEALADQPTPAPTPAPAPAPAAIAPVTDQVTLSKADLEALLDEREARAKRDAAS
jgi:sec-independent protein translocase protein TatA